MKLLPFCTVLLPGIQSALGFASPKQPDILFVISDDQSWPYASAYGTKWIHTPGFDEVANRGVLFTNAYVTSPGSSPSRASILTGRYPWQLEEAGTHASSFPSKYKTFTQVLEDNGYGVGFTGKPWSPGNWEISGWKQNPVGKEYNQKKLKPPYSGISSTDYAGNFEAFLGKLKSGQPFFFWLGAQEPHRAFEEGSWIKEGKTPGEAEVPGFLPDDQVIRKDLLDYAVEIEWFDSQLAKVLEILKKAGRLENTLIIVTSDNGMPFPRAKANCYDAGLHVPMAICWGSRIPAGKKDTNILTTVDLAPTILEAAGLAFESEYPMSGKSILKRLVTGIPSRSGNNSAYAGRERHSSSRYLNRGYPQRAVRSDDFLYIVNMHPGYWPAGDPAVYLKDGTTGKFHGAYLDIDNGPTLSLYRERNVSDTLMKKFFLAATEKRPGEELYNLASDPFCMKNLAGDPFYEAVRRRLSKDLMKTLKETGDTRITGSNPEVWETYPRLNGEIRDFPPDDSYLKFP